MKIATLVSIVAVAAAACFTAGCQSTQVAVDSKAHSTAEFKNGCLYGKVKGNVDKVFFAANKAIDKLGYFRTTGNEPAKAMTQVVGARAKGDLRIEVLLEEKEPGTTSVRVAYGSGDSAKSQEILNKIYDCM